MKIKLSLFLSLLWCLSSATAQEPQGSLPERSVVIDVNAPGRALYKVAVAPIQGEPDVSAQATETISNDLRLSSLFEVLNPASFIADLRKEGLGIEPKPWIAVGAQAVVKGTATTTGQTVTFEFRLYEVGKRGVATLTRQYKGPRANVRSFAHAFSNQILKALTGEEGVFHTRLTFARRSGPGKKDVYVADYDGHGLGRISSARGVSMLPAFGPGGIWYSVLLRSGMYITRSGMRDRPVIKSAGLNMGVTHCNGRLFFSSTRHENSEIYSANLDGSDVRRLTNHRAIDISPSCGPGGQIAFVSNRHGSPQIFTMNAEGGNVKRVTYKGSYNQTPSWCKKANTPLIAFTGQDGGFDIFTVNLQTGEYKRLTQGQGSNKDPAFSSDCRMIAFTSTRGGGGIFLMNTDGLNQTSVLKGGAETVRWSE